MNLRGYDIDWHVVMKRVTVTLDSTAKVLNMKAGDVWCEVGAE